MPLATAADLAPEQVLVSVNAAKVGDPLDSGPRVTVLGRRTPNDHVAVVPEVRPDGTFTGHRWMLAHIPTGICIASVRDADQAHDIAAAVADLDWASITGPDSITDSFKAAWMQRIGRLAKADEDTTWSPTAADRWAEANAGVPIPGRAVALAGWSLEGVQEAWGRTFDNTHEHAVPFYLPDTVSDEHPRGEPNPLWMHWVVRASDLFGVAFLLLVLRRVNPDTADAAAAWLAGQWEAGDGVGEWSWDLARIVAEGRTDTADIPTAPPAPGPLLTGAQA